MDQTQSSDNRTARHLQRFRRRCLLFVLPLLVCTVPALSILFVTGEAFVDADDLLKRLNDEPLLIGFAYNEPWYRHLKYRRLASLPRRSVVALGSSRVLGFREEMFRDRFYNAGYTIVSPWDFRTFLSLIPADRLPDTIILGLDQFMFCPDSRRRRPPLERTVWARPPRDDLNTSVRLIPDVCKDLLRGRIDLRTVLTHAMSASDTHSARPVGLNSLINRKGMRNDGSFLYGSQIRRLLESDPQARDHGFADTLRRVRRRGRRFEGGRDVDAAAVEEIERLLQFCHDHGVMVVAFLPPYADAVWQAMLDTGDFSYMEKIESALRPAFDRYGFELYAFHRMSDCGASDAEAVDGFHAGEPVYLRMLIAMLRQGSILNRHTDIRQLTDDLRHCVNRYTAYREPGTTDTALAASGSPRSSRAMRSAARNMPSPLPKRRRPVRPVADSRPETHTH